MTPLNSYTIRHYREASIDAGLAEMIAAGHMVVDHTTTRRLWWRRHHVVYVQRRTPPAPVTAQPRRPR